MAARIRALTASARTEDAVAAAVLRREISKRVLEWGVVDISGLEINGAPATKQTLLEEGPEELSIEILEELQQRLSLNEQERKN